MRSRERLKLLGLCAIALVLPAAIIAAVVLNQNDEPPIDLVRSRAWGNTVEPRLQTAEEAGAEKWS